MLRREWMQTQSTKTWKPKVEQHEMSNGEIFYSFDNGHRRYDITEKEAIEIIKDWRMTEVTERLRAEGWIAE